MSYNCDQREEQDYEAPEAQPEANEEQSGASGGQPQAAGGSDDIVNEVIGPNKDHLADKNPESRNEEMDYDDQSSGLKEAACHRLILTASPPAVPD